MNQETNLDKALEAIRNGEFVLVFDDDDREGEVDMIIASENRQTGSFGCSAETVTYFHVLFSTYFLS